MTYDPYASRGVSPHGSEYPNAVPQRSASPSWDDVYAQSSTPAHGQEIPAHAMPSPQASPAWQSVQPVASRAADDPSFGPQTQPSNSYGPPPIPQPAAPGQHGTAPQPSYGGYGAPQPPQPSYGGYGAPQQPLQGAPGPVISQQGYYPPASVQPNALYSNIQLNYWLSAFIPIAAVVFYFVDKGKTPLADAHLKEVLNLAIVRMIVLTLVAIPFVEFVAFPIALALLVIGIIGAIKGTEAYRNGQDYQYPFNLRIVS